MDRAEDILLFFVVWCVCRISSQPYPITFQMRTAAQITLRAAEPHQTAIPFALPEQRRKLCMYAAMEANLAYIDYNYTPRWDGYVRTSSSEIFDYGMYCATSPTIYILQNTSNLSPSLQITFVRPKVHFEFNTALIMADVVLHNYNVPEAGAYEFKYSGQRAEIHFAIPCPTLPKLYLRESWRTNTLELVFQRTQIDYEFEMDENGSAASISELAVELLYTSYPAAGSAGHSLTRLNEEERMNLCAIAQKYFGPYYVPLRELAYVPEARTYTFQYSEEQEKFDEVAVSCPTSSLYLRSISAEGITRIILTFGLTLADRYTYSVEIVSNLVPLSSTEVAEHQKKLERQWKQDRERGGTGVGDEYARETLTPRQFAQLDAQGGWNLCLAAQKHVRGRREYTFIFATQQSVLFNAKLLLLPEYVSSPRFYKIVSPHAANNNNNNNNNNNGKIDIFIECSQWPQMYLSPGFKGINIILFERELSNRYFDSDYLQPPSEY